MSFPKTTAASSNRISLALRRRPLIHCYLSSSAIMPSLASITQYCSSAMRVHAHFLAPPVRQTAQADGPGVHCARVACHALLCLLCPQRSLRTAGKLLLHSSCPVCSPSTRSKVRRPTRRLAGDGQVEGNRRTIQAS